MSAARLVEIVSGAPMIYGDRKSSTSKRRSALSAPEVLICACTSAFLIHLCQRIRAIKKLKYWCCVASCWRSLPHSACPCRSCRADKRDGVMRVGRHPSEVVGRRTDDRPGAAGVRTDIQNHCIHRVKQGKRLACLHQLAKTLVRCVPRGRSRRSAASPLSPAPAHRLRQAAFSV